MTICKNCNKEYVAGRTTYRIYCSNKCQQEFSRKKRYEEWRTGGTPTQSSKTMASLLREYESNKCAVCGITEHNGLPLNMQCDHIDGNSDNNLYTNIRLICPNCDAQSTTYKGRNKGSGRHYRRVRYAEGKSY